MTGPDAYRQLAQAMLKGAKDEKTRIAAEKCLEVAIVYELYEQALTERKAVDFGDLIMNRDPWPGDSVSRLCTGKRRETGEAERRRKNQVCGGAMIRNETEYQEASSRLVDERNRLAQHRKRLKEARAMRKEIRS